MKKTSKTPSFWEHVCSSFSLLGNSYLVGPFFANYLSLRNKFRFLQVKDSIYDVVTQKRTVAKYQAKHNPIGCLAKTDKFLFIRELLQDRNTKSYYDVERVVSLNSKSALFIPIFKGKFVIYSVYRYALHRYQYEFLRSVDNIQADTDDNLYNFFTRCSGLKDSVSKMIHLGYVTPDSTMSHTKIAVYAVILNDLNFDSIDTKNGSLVPIFHRKFNKLECCSLSELYSYIHDDKFVDGVSLSALSMWCAYLAHGSMDSLLGALKK